MLSRPPSSPTCAWTSTQACGWWAAARTRRWCTTTTSPAPWKRRSGGRSWRASRRAWSACFRARAKGETRGTATPSPSPSEQLGDGPRRGAPEGRCEAGCRRSRPPAPAAAAGHWRQPLEPPPSASNDNWRTRRGFSLCAMISVRRRSVRLWGNSCCPSGQDPLAPLNQAAGDTRKRTAWSWQLAGGAGEGVLPAHSKQLFLVSEFD
mmetsp:Transcript_25208/g.70652  ORF Transcript_25208/g.70652 Transcript_25208/m.70652 type:complete len:207 (+) Transcript_25208:521-1141(+)